MKTSKLGKRTSKARPAYNKLSGAKNSQHPLAGKKPGSFRTLSRRIALDYKAKNMNPAIANKAGRAIAGMISETTGRFNRTKA